MNRKRRTEILIRGRRKLSEKLSEEIKNKYEIKNVQDPENGLVMIKMRETAKKQLFYLGEVLVTEAKVSINGNLGLGIVNGDEEKLAYDLAVIDAAYNAELNETKMWDDLLIAEEQMINELERKESAKIMETKVDFTTMNV